MGEQRARDSGFFYHLDELRELTGYTPTRLNEISKRYKNRCGANGRRKRVFYLAKEKICNDEFSSWLLSHRFRGMLVTTRPAGTLTLKQAVRAGLSYDVLRRHIQRGDLEAYIHRGRYLVERGAVQALSERYAPAPNNWLAVVTLIELSGRARQSVYAWVERQSETRTFMHPKRAQSARYLPVSDALLYLSQILGNTHRAIKRLAQSAPCYVRSLSKSMVAGHFNTREAKLQNLTFDTPLISNTLFSPPLNASQLGHGLLELRT